MKLRKDQRLKLIDDLIEVALDILHHDIDLADEAGKWEIKSLREKFNAVLSGDDHGN